MKRSKQKNIEEKSTAVTVATDEEGVREILADPDSSDTASLQEEAKEEEKSENKTCGAPIKIAVVLVLLVIAAFLVLYFLLPKNMFVPGSEVDLETFKDIFAVAENVYIVMDVRDVNNNAAQVNILQCGVDFAGSSGMANKSVEYYSLAEGECIAYDGSHSEEYCFTKMQDGITIYIREGAGDTEFAGDTKFYTNGMVVTMGSEYTLGTCGIHRV